MVVLGLALCGPRVHGLSPKEPLQDAARLRALASRNPDGTAVGSLPLELSVDDAGRAAGLIAIDVPPGTGTMQPNLAFAYGSQRPNGKLGAGWDISGLSLVTRVGANLEQDGFRGAVQWNAKDRFTLDGMRLIAVKGVDGETGSQYRTEKETWQLATAAGSCGAGPCVFTVQNNRGETLEYGGTADSRILAGSGPTVWTWALNRRTDLSGNSVEYSYTRTPFGGAPDRNDFYIQKISYTTNAAAPIPGVRTVSFTYEGRPDVVTWFMGGIGFATVARLSHVITAVGDAVVSDYRLTYGPPAPATGSSRLAAIAHCDGAAAAALCLPATGFDWQSTTPSSVDLGKWLSGPSFVEEFLFPAWDPASNPRFLADVDGDGRADIVGFRLGVQVSRSTGSSFAPMTQWSADFGPGWTARTPRMLADVNGDGKADVVGFGNQGLLVGISDGTKFDTSLWEGQGDTFFTTGWSSDQNPRMLADVNGDGLADIVGFRDKTYVALSTGKSFAPPTSWNDSDFTGPAWFTQLGALRILADVNGDGLADVIGFGPNGVVVGIATGHSFDTSLWPQNATGFPFFANAGGWRPGVHPRFLADVNGDGLADIVGFKDGVWVALSTGTGFLPPQKWNDGFSLESRPPWPSDSTRFVVDIDGDGRADIVGFNSGGATIALSNGQDAFVTGSWNAAALASYVGTNPNFPILIGDAAGTGLPAAVAFGARTTTTKELTVGAPAGPYPDLLTRLSTGWGGLHLLTYLPMTDSAVYTPGPAAPGSGLDALANITPPAPFAFNAFASNFPVLSIQSGNSYLVSSYRETNDPLRSPYAYDFTLGYSYSGAKLDVRAGRDLGLATMTTHRKSTGQTTTVRFNQAFPLTRSHRQTTVACGAGSAGFDPRCRPGAIVSQIDSTYAAQTTATGSTGTRPVIAFPALTAEQEDYFDYGTYNFSIGQQHVYDAWGNDSLTRYLDTVNLAGEPTGSGADRYLVCSAYSTFAPDDFRYRAFLTARKVTRAATCDFGRFANGIDLELTDYSYSSDGKMRLLSEAQFNDQSGTSLLYTYAYDAWGNPVLVTAPNGNATAIVYDADFHTFPVLQTSPELSRAGGTYRLVNQLYYEPRFGMLSSKVDPNGLATVNCPDSFGRLTLVQTTAPPGSATDLNCLPAGVAGASAAVATLREQSWNNDGAIYRLSRDLQSWPTGAARVLQDHRVYVDGLNRTYKKANQSAGPTGWTDICFEQNDVGSTTGTSAPAFLAVDFNCQGGAGSLLWQRQRYDIADRVVNVATPDGPDGRSPSVTTYAYANSNQITITQGAGSPQPFSRVLSQVVRSSKQLLSGLTVPGDGNALSQFAYDPLGRLISTTDPLGVTTAIGYDSLSRRISLASPDFGAVAYDYRGTDQVMTMTTALGSTAYSYDPLGRLLQSSGSDGSSVVYSYDDPAVPNSLQLLTGAVVTTAAGEPVRTAVQAYDPYGHATAEALTLPGVAAPYVTGRTYDPQGRLLAVALPESSGTIGYSYSQSTLAAISWNGTPAISFAGYNPLGQKGAVTFLQPNTVETYAYDPVGHLRGLAVDGTSGKLLDLSWTWNLVDEVTAVTDHLKPSGIDFSESFTYGSLRLTGAVGRYGTKAFAYDRGGNLVGDGSTSYQYQAHRAVTGTSGGQPVFAATYDGAGNMATKQAAGVAWLYDRNLDGLLTAVRQEGVAAPVYTFTTDYTGRRVVSTSPQQVVRWINTNFKEVQAPNGTVTRIASLFDGSTAVAAAILQGAAPTWLYLDHNQVGSTILASKADGTVGSYIVYEPYGGIQFIDPAFAALLDRKFTGRELDTASGLYYFTTRYYDPVLTRFLSPDHGAGGDLDRTDSLNPFAYGLNDPASYVDQNGTQGWSLFSNVFGMAARTGGTPILRTSSSLLRWSSMVRPPVSQLGFTRFASTARPTAWSGFRPAISYGDNLSTTVFNRSTSLSPADAVQSVSTNTARGLEQGTIDVFNGRSQAKLAEQIASKGIKWDLIQADSRFGKAFYVTEDLKTAEAELRYHGQSLTSYVRLKLDLSRARLLDLTDSETAKTWGERFPGWDSSGGYRASQALADAAREGGYDGIRFSSLRNPGGTNYALFAPRSTAAADAAETAATGATRAASTAATSVAGEGATVAAAGAEAVEGAAATAETGLEFLAIVGVAIL